MSIPFTQFLRPDGRRKPTSIDMDPKTEEVAAALIDAGIQFEIEELMTGKVSMECINYAIEDGEPGFLVANAICDNGPSVLVAVADLVTRAHERMFAQKAGE